MNEYREKGLRKTHSQANKEIDSAFLEDLLKQITTLPPDFHKAGCLSVDRLEAINCHLPVLPLDHSLETGSGLSTLLLSNISRHHLVFSLDGGNGSLENVRKSSLFEKNNTEIIEGPTQHTLPKYSFQYKLDFALIDGPHGFPFPQIEYYYVYQHLKTGAIMVLDDIHIPSITDLFNFINEDEMFELLEVVNKTTAIFRRTSAPVFSPFGDNWWTQKYNKKNFPESLLDEKLRNLLER